MHGNFVILHPFYLLISALIKINVNDSNNVIDNDDNNLQQILSRKKTGTTKRKYNVSSVLLLMHGIGIQVKKNISP